MVYIGRGYLSLKYFFVFDCICEKKDRGSFFLFLGSLFFDFGVNNVLVLFEFFVLWLLLNRFVWWRSELFVGFGESEVF